MEYMSQECYDELVAEIDHLINVELPKVKGTLVEARAQGDLSENFEYHAAKREHGKLLGKIRFKQNVLKFARVLDTSQLKCEVAGLLRKVEITNLATGTRATYTIVNPHEANLREGKISIKSPIGEALVGKRVGDETEVHVPAGVLHLRVEGISI